MSTTTAVIFLVSAGLFAIMVYGLFNRKKIILVGLISFCAAAMALLGAWYSWTESQSVPWAIGYIIAAVIGFISAARQCFTKASQKV